MKKQQARPVGIQGKAFSPFEVMAKLRQQAAEEAARVAAMTPEQRAVHDEEQRKLAVEREEILKQLRGPGFSEFKVK